MKLLKEKISTLLEETENCIAQGKVKEAKQSLYSLRDKIVRIKDVVIRQRYIQAQDALTKLEDALEQKRIARLAEEQRRKMKRHVRGKKNRNESKESRNARKKNFVENGRKKWTSVPKRLKEGASRTIRKATVGNIINREKRKLE